MSYPSLLTRADPTGEHQRFLRPYRRLLEVSHHFLCRSSVERAALISTLCTVGRITPEDIARSATLDQLVTMVPVGFGRQGMDMADAVEPAHLADFLWTGGIWSFFDPLLLVEAMAVLRDRGVDATAAFLHAVPTEDTRGSIEQITKAIANLGLGERVRLCHTPLSQAEREQYVKAAKAYVCIARPGVENETGTRLRLRDTVLHGVPMIIDPWGITAGIVGSEDLGVVLREPGSEALADVLERVLSGSSAGTGRRLERLYENSLVPLVRWLDETLGYERRQSRNEQVEAL